MYATCVHVKSYTSFYFHVRSLPFSVIINFQLCKQTRFAPKLWCGTAKEGTRTIHAIIRTCALDSSYPLALWRARARAHSQTELDLSETGFAHAQPTKVVTAAPPVGSQRDTTVGNHKSRSQTCVIEIGWYLPIFNVIMYMISFMCVLCPHNSVPFSCTFRLSYSVQIATNINKSEHRKAKKGEIWGVTSQFITLESLSRSWCMAEIGALEGSVLIIAHLTCISNAVPKAWLI